MPILRKAEEKLGLLIVSKILSGDCSVYVQLEAIPVGSLDPPEGPKDREAQRVRGLLQGKGRSRGRKNT